MRWKLIVQLIGASENISEKKKTEPNARFLPDR